MNNPSTILSIQMVLLIIQILAVVGVIMYNMNKAKY